MNQEQIDAELNLVSIWIHNCIIRMCCNAYIDKTKVNHHPQYTFQEFKDAIYDPWTGETMAEREVKIHNLKHLFTNQI